MWTDTFFDETTMEFWRQACPPAQTDSEIRMMDALQFYSAGSRILDLPCGLGRHALELAARGCHVTAQDASSYAVEQLKEESRSRELELDIRLGEMREIPETSVFDGVLCMGNSLGYFGSDDTADYFQSVGRALKSGGRLLLESSVVAESLLPNLDERNWLEVGEFLLLIENRYSVQESRVDTTFTFIRRGKRKEHLAHHHVFTVQQMREMLSRANLNVVGLYSSVDLQPFEVGSDRLFLLARKGK